MNQEIKARWVAALRSGEYEQGQAFLRKGDRFCCLGVLCDLAVKDDVISAPTPDDEHVYHYGTAFEARAEILPDVVREWAGLIDVNPAVDKGTGFSPFPDEEYEPDVETLAEINDDGAALYEIADLIEDQL